MAPRRAARARSYTDAFLQRQAPWLFTLLLLNLPLMAVALLKGRRPAGLRRVDPSAFPLLNSGFRWVRPHDP